MFYSKFAVHSWCVQRVASLGLLVVLCLLYLAVWHDRPLQPPHDVLPSKGKASNGYPELTKSQMVYIFFTLFVHIMGLNFQTRLCWTTWKMTKKLRKVLKQTNALFPLHLGSPSKPGESGFGLEGYESSNSSFTSESSSPSVIEKEDTLPLLHTIIIPNYKEDLDTLRETLEVLACHPQASSTYEICLAMEEGEAGCKAKATTLISEYAEHFRSVECTIHPRDIPGEAQGKSSNLAWAANHINGKYQSAKTKKNVIITVVDADSYLSARYFTLINGMHERHPQTAETTIYVPPIVFDRNAHQVPTPVRVADMLWGGAGLSGHNSVICPPTSVYSMTLSLVDRAGGWDGGPEAIGEDLHMYIKCFFALKGNLTTRTIFSAASNSNVSTGAQGVKGWFKDCHARYRQALRHMWGALDSGYVLKCVLNMLWNSNRKATGLDRPNWFNTFVLFHRMYEAHFLPTQITLFIIGGALFTVFIPAGNINPLLQHTLDITAYLRIASLLCLGIFFYLYESYHHLCVTDREGEMLRAGLADKMQGSFSYRKFQKNWLDLCFFPLSGIAFGSLPTMVALICHFWTIRLVYKVSKKPTWTTLTQVLSSPPGP